MEQFQQILLKYKWPIRIEGIKTSIKEIEATFHFVLPSDYKDFLQKYLGSENFIGEEFVRLWDAEEIIELNRSYNIVDNLPMTIAIGSNGSSEYLAIEMVCKDNYRVVISPFIDLDKQYHIEIGTSFTDFLLRTDSGQDWFKRA